MAFQTPVYSQGIHHIAGVSSSEEPPKVETNVFAHAQRLAHTIQSV